MRISHDFYGFIVFTAYFSYEKVMSVRLCEHIKIKYVEIASYGLIFLDQHLPQIWGIIQSAQLFHDEGPYHIINYMRI